ncbi:unnamed protein product [Rotaria sp. Silwood2]|nr:unnamed protein product [Rotaria sp. Silwood2]CAF2762455.1 unnamed protein product [Rotaria sp. Silwood2]CAF2990806.1 unnamed protein product [Rotaria sp. Silwood2]CAF3128296.1 unnamed protein product [Rotaria sp. Silwood2]CAF3937363.1 unnamed protein product [Rotaria sp. Silwood2]
MNVNKLHGDEISTVIKPQITKVNPPETAKQQRNHSINARISRQPITEDHSSRIGSITVTRVRCLYNNSKRRESDGTTIVHGNNGGHKNNKINATSVSPQKSKTQSHRSRHRKINVNVRN